MIYLDTSVALAHMLAEDIHPPASLWAQELVASRLMEFELWNRLNRLGLERSHGDAARMLLSRVGWVAMERTILERAFAPFPSPVRTLAALHLATLSFLNRHERSVELASYDRRMVEVAGQMDIQCWDGLDG